MTIGVPDLDAIYEEYRKRMTDNLCPSTVAPKFILGHPLEELNYYFHQEGDHKFLYNEQFLSALLTHFGFKNVLRRPFDSLMDSEHRREGTLYMVATKP